MLSQVKTIPTTIRVWPIALSPSELARCLGIPRARIYEAIKKRQIVCHQQGTHRRITVARAIEWIERFWPTVKSDFVPTAREQNDLDDITQ